MQKLKTPSAIKKHYQKHLAKMTHSFLLQTLDQPEEKVLEIYEAFCKSWSETVVKINKRYEAFVLADGAWRNIWERDAYRNLVTKPIAPEEKAALMRIIFIVEGKTEHQRQRRELFYKYIAIVVRLKMFFRKLFAKKIPAVQ